MTHLNIYSALATNIRGTICMYSGKTEQDPKARLNQRHYSHATPCDESALIRTIKCPHSKSKEEEQRYINTTRQIARDFQDIGWRFHVENVQNPASHITEINQPLYKAIKKRLYQMLLYRPKAVQNTMDSKKDEMDRAIQRIEQIKTEIEEAIIKKQKTEEFVSNVISTHF